MSIEVTAAVWKHAPVDGANLLLLLALGDFADDDGGCWPSIATLAKKARISDRSVQRGLADMAKAGFIRIETGAGPRGCNRYFVQVAAIRLASVTKAKPAEPGVETAAETPAETSETPAQGGDTLSPPDAVTGVTLMPEGVTSTTGGGDTCVTRTVIEPSIEPERESAQARDGQAGERAGSTDAPGSAAFQKRVQRFCSGQGFKAGPWPGWEESSLGWIGRQFAALDDAGRAAAERWRDAYLADLARRSLKPVPVGTFLRDRTWEALDPRLLDRVPEPATAASDHAPPFGPAWGAWVAAQWLAGPVNGERLGPMALPRDVRRVWPRLAHVLSEAKCGRGARFGERWHRAGRALTEPVPVDGAVMADWRAHLAAEGWPPLPDTGGQRVIHLPKGGPAGLMEFDAALAAQMEPKQGSDAATARDAGGVAQGSGQQGSEAA